MSQTRFSRIVFFLIALGQLTNAKLPADIPKCHAGDVKCIKNSMNYIMRTYPLGNPDFGLVPLNSVALENVIVSKANPNSPIQLNFKFNTLNVLGMENATVARVVGFAKDLEKHPKHEVHMRIPVLKMIGEYETSGKVLLLPINGKGHCEISMTGVKASLTNKAKLEKINGKNYAKIYDIKSNMEIERLHVNLENLFGQKELSDAMNEIINENWQDIWAEIHDGANAAVRKSVTTMIISSLKVLPFDEFYLDDDDDDES